MKKITTLLAILAVLGFLATPIIADAGPNAEEIVAKAWKSYRSLKAEKLTIKLTTAKGKVYRLICWTMLDPAGEDRTLIKYLEPKLDRGMGLLTWRHRGGKDEQWFKPSDMAKSRRISPGEKGKHFQDTEYIHEDIERQSGDDTGKFDYKLEKKEGNAWIIKETPKAGTQSAYGSRLLMVNERFQIVGIDFLDKTGDRIKSQTNLYMNTVNSAWRPNRIEVYNDRTGKRMVVEVEKREAGQDISGHIFTANFLESEEF